MKKSLIALAVLAAVPFGLAAQELNYNFVEAGYLQSNINGAADPDGWGVGASAALGSNFQMFGNWSNQEYQHSGVDFDRWRIGFGYRHGLAANVDLLARMAYEKLDFGYGYDLDGYSAEMGVRAAMGKHFEGWALGGHSDARGGNGDFYGRLGGQYKFNRQWGISAEARFENGMDTVFVGPRLSF